ncbi:winged helix DNA-binding protein [Sphingobium aquiterrae]|uniref:winged helix DNA-binding protein n=1 Tax=Sphingobium aquiterrae TaxID=2038656 RepID=UPI00301A27F0
MPDLRPSLMIFAGDPVRDQIAAMANAVGLRLLGGVPVAEAEARLERTVDVDVVLLHWSAADTTLVPLAARLDMMARASGTQLIVIAGMESVDAAFAQLHDASVQLLCEPGPVELASALSMAIAGRAVPAALSDIGRESETSRLQRLSEEVGRLARRLDALTRHGGTAAPAAGVTALSGRPGSYLDMAPAPAPRAPDMAMGGTGTLTAMQIRDLIRTRRLRDQFLPADLFADPAWDMMLDLMAARLAGERVSVSSLCIAAAVPPTTALRWIRQLTDRGMLERHADPTDGRRVFIALSDGAAEALTRWHGASRRSLAAAAG